MSNGPTPQINSDNPDNTKKRSRIPWNGFGLFFSTFAVVGLIFIVIAAFTQLIFINTKLSDQIATLDNNLALIQQQTENTLVIQQNKINELSQSQNKSSNTWKILEANHLVILANNNLQLNSDVAASIKMLQFASQELQVSNDAKLNLIQQAIANDLDKLKSAQQINTPELYSKILALIVKIDQLPLKINQEKIQSSPNDVNLPWWHRGWQTTLKILQNIVIIRHTPTGTLPLVTPEEQAFFFQNFHTLLVQTSWALLHGQNEIYHASLQQIIDWIEIYFVKDSTATKTALADLQQLQQIDIHPVIPELTSVRAFQDYFSTAQQGV